MYDPDQPRSVPQTALQPRSETASLPDALIARVWQVMASMYGNAWTSQYGVDPAGDAARLWARRLAGFTTQQIAQGLRACERADSDFPPSLPAFRKWCLGCDDDPQTQGAEAVQANREYLEARDRGDLAHFRLMNEIWRETHKDDLFNIPLCFTEQQRRFLGIYP